MTTVVGNSTVDLGTPSVCRLIFPFPHFLTRRLLRDGRWVVTNNFKGL